jgi:GNAT superfamily N-acetyltransferase
MDFNQFALERLHSDSQLTPFDCGDEDLNDFIINDAKDFHNHLIAVTYLLKFDKKVVAFFSVLNDRISIEDFDSNRQFWGVIRSIMPEGKRFRSYPAVKLGRLGVDASFKGQKIGKSILDYLKYLFITENRTGCRYITVDAYNKSIGFYQKNGFLFLKNKNEGGHTRLMYFDLKTIKDSN